MSRFWTIDVDTNHVRLFDYNSGVLVKEILLKAQPWFVAVAPAGDRVAVALEDNHTLLLASDTFKKVRTLSSGDTMTVAFSPDGKYIAAGGSDDVVYLYNAVNLSIITKGEGCESNIWALAFSPSSQFIASGTTTDNMIILWSVPDMVGVKALQGHNACVFSIVYLTENRVASVGDDGGLHVWDADSLVELHSSVEHTEAVGSISVSQDGAHFATGSHDNNVKIFDAKTYLNIKTIKMADQVKSVCFIDMNTVLVGVYNRELVAVDIHSGDIVKTFLKHEDPNAIAAFVGKGAVSTVVFISNSVPHTMLQPLRRVCRRPWCDGVGVNRSFHPLPWFESVQMHLFYITKSL